MNTAKALGDQTEWEKKLVIKVAKQFEVEPEALWQNYRIIMECNFEQDLWGIAKENLEELKESSKGK